MKHAPHALLGALAAATAVADLPPFDLLDLGDFAGGNGSGGAFGINGRGEPVGAADDAIGRQAFIYTSKGLTRLPTPNLPHAVYSEAFFANNHGVVAGNTYSASLRSRAAYWDHLGYHDLGTLGGAESWVLGLNAAGAIIGLSDAVESFAYFMWLPVPMYGLPAGMNTVTGHFPRALNDAGQTASQITPTPPNTFFQPAIWLPEPAYGLPAGVNDLATDIFPGGVVPQAINNRGAIVGGGRGIDGVQTPALWLPEPMYGLPAGWHDLGMVNPERDRGSFGWDINERGWIVGTRIWAGDPPNEFEDPPIFTEGWLWIPPSSPGHGRRALDELTPPAAPGEAYFIFYPRAINNRGQIAASAASVAYGQYRAVLLSPVCPADWNADAELNSSDFFDFLADFFADAADYNDDGGTNSADFFDMLTDFFSGC